jgi:hypothetical protein
MIASTRPTPRWLVLVLIGGVDVVVWQVMVFFLFLIREIAHQGKQWPVRGYDNQADHYSGYDQSHWFNCFG